MPQHALADDDATLPPWRPTYDVDLPTATMAAHPGTSTPGRPYVPSPYNGPTGPATAPAPVSPPSPEAPEAPTELSGPVLRPSGSFRPTIGDLALANELELADPNGTASHVELAVTARRWFAVNSPQRWPTEAKVVAATVGAGAAAVLALVLDRAQDVVPLLSGLPSWVGPALLVLGPPLAAFLRGYAAPHSPRGPLAPVPGEVPLTDVEPGENVATG